MRFVSRRHGRHGLDVAERCRVGAACVRRPRRARRPAGRPRPCRRRQLCRRRRTAEPGGRQHRRQQRARGVRRRPLATPGRRRPDTLDEPFDFRRRGEQPRRGAGTGFIIDENGYILTNHHVIEGAERILVKLTDGRSLLRRGRSASDPDTDIALIKCSERRQAAACDARRFRRFARGRVGVRDRQPARLRTHRDRWRGQLHRPQAVRHEPGQLHPDRCGDQFRQQRRTADQRARRSDRHQLGHQPAGQQHRLCRSRSIRPS